MSGPLVLFLVFLGGLLMGWAYFGGLMLTVLKARSSDRPALLFLGSFLIRTGVTLPLFLVMGGSRWDRYAVCLLGFLASRGLAALLWGPRQRGGNEVKTWRS